ncbi:uncharacterized protein YndB with AHSA1/START domain [Stackebrandtia endophytica]|uniref:Uncharacterized protein YndB with AHSA1/START domain n=1 Tax=Stackebrandtia endophytica TaxID=1496996 RepID=A0A543B1X8_9ACTN|nr:SRPBCC domain-containing protein [Stackebrandtia endophytica]TQL78827.1 uncharacterized protein YndB with AHSA1/START domain [Stackebrandtia endophytica]
MAVVERTISAPVEEVFAVLADGWSYSNWVVGTAHVAKVDAGWPQEGSRIWIRTGVWPVDAPGHTRSLTFEPPHRLVLRPTLWPAGELTVTLTLSTESPGRTRVRLEEDIARGPLRGLRNKLNDVLLHARNVASLRRLADIAERRPAPTERPYEAEQG